MEKVLVADTAFIGDRVRASYEFISIFPSHDYVSGEGVGRVYELLKKRTIIQSRYYDETIKEILPFFLDQCVESDAKYNLEPLIRPSFVHLTSLFVDRAIGILDRLNQQDADELHVCKVSRYGDIASHDDLRSISSWHWNQYIIYFICSTMGLKPIEIFHQSQYPEIPDSNTQKNFLFRKVHKNKYLDIVDRIFTRILRLQKKMNNPFARFISVGFSGDDYYFLRNGFYGIFGVFRTVKFEPMTCTRNDELRCSLHELTARILEKNFLSLLNHLDLNSKNEHLFKSLAKAYSEFIFKYLPEQNIEALSSNLQAASNIIKKIKARNIISSDITTNVVNFLAVALKENNKNGEVVGVQHGGHYGYIDAMSSHAEFEYAVCDKFVTWGWSEFEQTLPTATAIKLPSPRLSNIDWIVPKNKKFQGRKILFMPNLLHRFPVLTTCGHSRIDFRDKIFSSRLALIEKMSEAASYIDIKPYNKNDYEFAKEDYLLLEQVAKKNVKIIGSTQKGLTASLIEGYDLIVWDQIGTGTLDCFVAGIPCLVYWDEIYSKPSSSSLSHVNNLRENGLVHSNSDRIAEEISLAFVDLNAWMNTDSRKAAIKRFVSAYALTDPLWSTIWRKKFKGL
ncbi:hypothetical protein OAD74_07160 [Alphaproteobacteria bacterium]|nr:hypothetical protein [Alphaproteobacteria bacterium]